MAELDDDDLLAELEAELAGSTETDENDRSANSSALQVPVNSSASGVSSEEFCSLQVRSQGYSWHCC